MNVESEQQDPQYRNRLWRFFQFFFQLFCIVWLRYRSRGCEHLPEGGALLLSNHQSFLDPLLIAVFLRRPVSFLARDNLFKVPIVGWILRSTYVMAIRRESAGTESLRKSIARLEQGFYVGLFPEGTRSRNGSLGNIKPGFLAVARRSRQPIVPVAVSGAYQAMPRGAWFIRPYPIRVVFGPPITPEEIEQLCERGREQEFLNLVQHRLQAALDEAEAWRTGRPLAQRQSTEADAGQL